PIVKEPVKEKLPKGENRRRTKRLPVEGFVELEKPGAPKNSKTGKAVPTKAVLKDLSHVGCQVQTKEVLLPGTDLKLVLKVANYDVTLKGQVRRSLDVGVGIEFMEIRKRDRETLKHLLNKLAEEQLEDIEVIVTP